MFTVMGKQSSREGLTAAGVIFWCLMAALVIAGRLYIVGGPKLSNDSYQYLSIANNLSAGEFAKTSLVYFDAERSHGEIPAPVTTWPIGYPVTIALLEKVGLSAEHAGLVVSIVSTWALVPMLLWCARWMEWPRAVIHLVIALLVANSWFSISATTVLSEPLFTAVMFFAVLAFVRASEGAGGNADADRRRAIWTLAACIALGLSYWIRYTGLFLFATAWIYYGLRWVRTRDRRSWQMIGGLMVSSSIIGTGLIRNQILVGSWMGGNTKPMYNGLRWVVHILVKTMYHLLFGLKKGRFGVAEVVCLVSAFVVIGVVGRELWKNKEASFISNSIGFVASFVVVYMAAMYYLAVSSVISFDDPRMFYPLLPCLLLLVGMLTRCPALSIVSTYRPAAIAVLSFLIMSFTTINFTSYIAPVPKMPDQRVTRRLSEKMMNGIPLRDWIEEHVPKEAIVVANDGQATGYVLKRGTVGFLQPHYTDLLWTEGAVRDVMDRFNAKFLILYRDDGFRDPVLTSSSFLLGLASRHFPPWLRLVAENDHAMVYERT